MHPYYRGQAPSLNFENQLFCKHIIIFEGGQISLKCDIFAYQDTPESEDIIFSTASEQLLTYRDQLYCRFPDDPVWKLDHDMKSIKFENCYTMLLAKQFSIVKLTAVDIRESRLMRWKKGSTAEECVGNRARCLVCSDKQAKAFKDAKVQLTVVITDSQTEALNEKTVFETIYTCSFCGAEEDTIESIVRHQVEEPCNMREVFYLGLKMHRLKVRCLLCGMFSPTNDAMKIHLVDSHKETSSFYPCLLCKLHFYTQSDKSKHIHTHHSVWKESHTCSRCEKKFSTQGKLNRHFRVVHMTERPYECDVCCESFKLQEKLTRHLKTHSKDKEFECSLCSKKFRTMSNLKQHLIHHKDPAPDKMVSEDRAEEADEFATSSIVGVSGSKFEIKVVSLDELNEEEQNQFLKRSLADKTEKVQILPVFINEINDGALVEETD